jgi:hypothetical protein
MRTTRPAESVLRVYGVDILIVADWRAVEPEPQPLRVESTAQRQLRRGVLQLFDPL